MRLNPEQKQKVLDMLSEGKSKSDIQTESGLEMKQINGIARRQKAHNTVATPNENIEGSIVEIDDATAESFAQAIEVPPEGPKENKTELKKVLRTVNKEPRAKKVKAVEPEEPKEAIIARIVIQVETFEPLLCGVMGEDKQEFIKSLPKRSAVELKALEKVIADTVKIGNLTNQMRHIYYMLCSGLEVGTSAIGLKSQGYTKVMMAQDREIKMILQEMALHYKDKVQVSTRPELRLAMLSVSTLLATDARNRHASTQPQPQPQAQPQPQPQPEPVAEQPRGASNVRPMFGSDDYSDL